MREVDRVEGELGNGSRVAFKHRNRVLGEDVGGLWCGPSSFHSRSLMELSVILWTWRHQYHKCPLRKDVLLNRQGRKQRVSWKYSQRGKNGFQAVSIICQTEKPHMKLYSISKVTDHSVGNFRKPINKIWHRSMGHEKNAVFVICLPTYFMVWKQIYNNNYWVNRLHYEQKQPNNWLVVVKWRIFRPLLFTQASAVWSNNQCSVAGNHLGPSKTLQTISPMSNPWRGAMM